VWATDRVLDVTPDPFVTLGAVAASTSRVKIGTCVALGVLRSPVLLAKAATTLDVLSEGRLLLGLGVGSRPDDFLATEVPIQQRGARMDELLAICQLAWSGAPLRFAGRHHTLDVGPLRQRPVQEPHPPVWFGGSADSVLRRVARVGQGFIASTSSGPTGFRAAWQTIQRYADGAERDIAEITPAALAYTSVADDAEAARVAMREHLVRSFGPARLERGLGPMVGTPDDLARGANEFFEAGVQVLILSSVSADPRHLDALCERVLPRIAAG
jgi:probable F420-dependent oxidoreductase